MSNLIIIIVYKQINNESIDNYFYLQLNLIIVGTIYIMKTKIVSG